MQRVLKPPTPTRAFADSTALLNDPEALRREYTRCGYLFLRGLLPVREVLEVRNDILQVCRRFGWLNPETETSEGRVGPGVGPYAESISPEYAEVYDVILRLESFHTLPHHPSLVRVLQDIFEEEPLIHPRHIARVVFPNLTTETTPPHQDFVHIGGTPETATVWIPLGDCPRELGGLVVQEGSHRLGLLDTVEARGAGGRGIPTDDLEPTWCSSPFSAGDVLIFPALTVHGGLPNLTGDRLRISMDVRAQPASQPVRWDSLLPHMQRVTWNEIYSGWKSKEFQRYWEKLSLKIIPPEDSSESTGY